MLVDSRQADWAIFYQCRYNSSGQHGPSNYQHWICSFFDLHNFLRSFGRFGHGLSLLYHFFASLRFIDYSARVFLSRLFDAVGVWHAFWVTEVITAIIAYCLYRKKVSIRNTEINKDL